MKTTVAAAVSANRKVWIFWSENATRPISCNGSVLNFTLVKQAGGHWSGYYATTDSDEMRLLLKECAHSKTLREITVSEFQSLTNAPNDDVAKAVDYENKPKPELSKSGRSLFYHSGDLGDVIYSLITVRELGGGEFLLGPDNQTAMATREKMSPQRADAIIPLLESQAYIHSAEFSEYMPHSVRYDLNQMRTLIRSGRIDRKPGYNLARAYLAAFGLALENDKKPWLTIDPVHVAPVVFARSPRYRDPKFRWDRVVEKYKGSSVFIGSNDEHSDFVKLFGRVPHHKTKNLLDVARVISGAKLFVGNQSCPYSIAEGLKKDSILETYPAGSNTIFDRDGVIRAVSEQTVLPEIGRSIPRKVKIGEPLVIRGPVDVFSGFGQVIQTIALGLNKSGIKIAVAPTMIGKEFAPLPEKYASLLVPQNTPGQIIISMHCGLPHLIKGGEVVMTMWESTRINPETCDALNKAGRVILPTTWSATSFNACGVDTPISIVPLGIDTKIYKPKPWPKVKKFIFGTAGRVAHGGIRKGIEEVISAFRKAFPEKERDVELRIKCFDDCPIKVPDDDRIKLHRRFLPDLADWYGDLHCFVTASRGEGWGLQPHQAMGCGRPVIAPRFSGLTTFFDDSVGWLADFELKPAGGYYEGKGIWAEVNVDDMAEKMRFAFEHRSEVKDLGANAAIRAARFSNENMVDKFQSVLRKAGVL